jgi:hypothetical protein
MIVVISTVLIEFVSLLEIMSRAHGCLSARGSDALPTPRTHVNGIRFAVDLQFTPTGRISNCKN